MENDAGVGLPSHLLGLFQQLCRECTRARTNLQDRVAAEDVALFHNGLLWGRETESQKGRRGQHVLCLSSLLPLYLARQTGNGNFENVERTLDGKR